MNELKDKLEMLTVMIGFISSLIAVVNCVYKNFNTIFYLAMFCACATGAILCFLMLKKYPILKRYKFIRYLFFEVDENKFNIAPKVLLFLDLKKKKNSIVVEELSIIYKLTENNGVIDSNVIWILKDVSNVLSNDFYFYTGIDLGRIQNQEFIITCNDHPETIPLLSDNQINSKNDIFLYHWNIPDRVIKKDNRIDEIKLSMDQKNSFDFNNKEVIYLFPWNFARKVEKIKLKVTYPISLGTISMQLFEVGEIKGKKFPFYHSFDTTAEERFSKDDNGTFVYEFCLEKDINVKNLYYILLHKNN